MINAGIAFQRSLGLREIAFTKVLKRPITRNNLGNQFGLTLR